MGEAGFSTIVRLQVRCDALNYPQLRAICIGAAMQVDLSTIVCLQNLCTIVTIDYLHPALPRNSKSGHLMQNIQAGFGCLGNTSSRKARSGPSCLRPAWRSHPGPCPAVVPRTTRISAPPRPWPSPRPRRLPRSGVGEEKPATYNGSTLIETTAQHFNVSIWKIVGLLTGVIVLGV